MPLVCGFYVIDMYVNSAEACTGVVGVVKVWLNRGKVVFHGRHTSMRTTSSAAITSAHPITGHIAKDVLGFQSGGHTDYKRVADLVQLSKEDLSKIAKVSKASVRFDENIPAAVAERLREIANIANLVAEYFNGDSHKVGLWFELPNPMLGNISPRTMIRGNRYRRLLNFVLDAREAEGAATRAGRRRS